MCTEEVWVLCGWLAEVSIKMLSVCVVAAVEERKQWSVGAPLLPLLTTNVISKLVGEIAARWLSRVKVCNRSTNSNTVLPSTGSKRELRRVKVLWIISVITGARKT